MSTKFFFLTSNKYSIYTWTPFNLVLFVTFPFDFCQWIKFLMSLTTITVKIMHRCINVKNFGVDSSMFILIFTYGFFCFYLDYSNIQVIPISLVSNRIALYFSLFKTFLYKLNIKLLRIVCYCETLHYSWIITL